MSDTRRPSARPPAAFIATGITFPMSRGDSAPASAIASVAMRPGSESDACAGS